jgi:hypothetical protein
MDRWRNDHRRKFNSRSYSSRRALRITCVTETTGLFSLALNNRSKERDISRSILVQSSTAALLRQVGHLVGIKGGILLPQSLGNENHKPFAMSTFTKQLWLSLPRGEFGKSLRTFRNAVFRVEWRLCATASREIPPFLVLRADTVSGHGWLICRQTIPAIDMNSAWAESILDHIRWQKST